MKKKTEVSFAQKRFDYNCNEENTSKCLPHSIILKTGLYLFDCYGASGSVGLGGGFGAHASASFLIAKPTTFFIYVGGSGGYPTPGKLGIGGFNGGGSGSSGMKKETGYYGGGYGGGGATDFRLIGGEWNNNESLHSRIIVAGGGGGYAFGLYGGSGGALKGLSSKGSEFSDSIEGGNQTAGGGFGFGQNGKTKTILAAYGCEGNGGGGGGWYGGYASQKEGKNSNAAGGGGSSYISGYPTCKPHPLLSAKSSFMENGLQTKHEGNGYAIITFIGGVSFRKNHSNYHHLSFIFVVLFEMKGTIKS